MADIQGTLSKKVGPLPVWGWAAAAGGLVSIIYLSRRGAAMGATDQSTGQTAGPFAPSPIIVTPQAMPQSTSSLNPGPPPAAAASSQGNLIVTPGPHSPGTGTFLRLSPTNLTGGIFIPAGTRLQQAGNPVNAKDPVLGPVPMIPVSYLGGSYYISTEDVSPATGSGGGSSYTSLVPGSGGGKLLRHVGPHAHQQYLAMSGMGGGVQTGPWAQDPKRGLAMNQGQNVVGGMGGGGHARLQAVSQRTGLPMTRLMSLNPAWKRRGHIHIA